MDLKSRIDEVLVGLKSIGIKNEIVFYQLTPDELVEQTLSRGEGVLNDTEALCINTGTFTGRSPKDKYIVKDEMTEKTVDWGGFNNPINEDYFLKLKSKLSVYLSYKDTIWVRDAYACADSTHKLNIRVINEDPWSNLFSYNMFLRPTDVDLVDFVPDWHIIQAPSFSADPAVDGTKQNNFAIVSFTHKMILIGGTGYTGEMKKGIFTILNYILPLEKNILSMHCSANIGNDDDVAVFFGLSGTGKTTLSADPQRKLIGDDEHGWTDNSVFNFEGGCYAKCIDLSEDKEPEIFHAIRPGALVENIVFKEGTNTIDFSNDSITENTRVSYPLNFISNAAEPSIGGLPKNIFFLTCDAYGVLPPISRLSPEQAMYQFISGYTAKVAGTEAGVTEPKATFSACFGAPFLPLHPGFYAELLGKKIREHNVNVWMVNTGWSGGAYGVGKRMKLSYTRAMISAVLNGSLDNLEYQAHPIFGMLVPTTCPNVPSEILDARNTWAFKDAYDAVAKDLASQFINNFKKYEAGVSAEIIAAAPKV